MNVVTIKFQTLSDLRSRSSTLSGTLLLPLAEIFPRRDLLIVIMYHVKYVNRYVHITEVCSGQSWMR